MTQDQQPSVEELMALVYARSQAEVKCVLNAQDESYWGHYRRCNELDEKIRAHLQQRPLPVREGTDETPAEDALRSLACWLGVGGYNAPTVDAKVFEAKIREGVTTYLPLHGMAARNLAELVLDMGMVTDKGIRARELARRVLGIVPPAASPSLPVREEPTLEDAYAEGRRDEQEELSSVLPGTTYMDPPDGGAPTILEQLQRQAKDAARYCWLRERFFGADFDWGGSDDQKGIPALVFKVDEFIQVWGDLDMTVDTALASSPSVQNMGEGETGKDGVEEDLNG